MEAMETSIEKTKMATMLTAQLPFFLLSKFKQN
jgi:hypothetical protein